MIFVNSQQKIGVFAGYSASALVQALFRLTQSDGKICVDGVDINEIGLHDLRKRISYLPQEAVLFSGSVRFNLDPFNERTDDELWHALDQTEMRTVVSALPIGLNSKVLYGGSNFNADQRQLLSLTRAILQRNQIIILDEANVNLETHNLIEKIVRRKFSNCTVITIAHRLSTVMAKDMVLVLDEGRIMEFGRPTELMKKPNGVFKRLFDQHGQSKVRTKAKKVSIL